MWSAQREWEHNVATVKVFFLHGIKDWRGKRKKNYCKKLFMQLGKLTYNTENEEEENIRPQGPTVKYISDNHATHAFAHRLCWF